MGREQERTATLLRQRLLTLNEFFIESRQLRGSIKNVCDKERHRTAIKYGKFKVNADKKCAL